MPTPTKGPRLGGGPAHERLMLANLATSLFEHGRITTTEAKAKRLRPLAERLVTFAKRGDLHARRQVMTVIRDHHVVHKLFAEIGPNYTERPGGYTRIIKMGPRKGDNAPMAIIELVEARTEKQEMVAAGERARGTQVCSAPGCRDARSRSPRTTRPSRPPPRQSPLEAADDEAAETRRGRCRATPTSAEAIDANNSIEDAADDEAMTRPTTLTPTRPRPPASSTAPTRSKHSR